MKRAKTKFAKPKYEGGGMLDWLNTSKNGGPTNASGIGAGLDILSSFIGNKQPNQVQDFGQFGSKAAEDYNKEMEKAMRTKQGISAGLGAAGSVAMMINPIVGIGLKGLGALTKALPIGEGKVEKAKKKFEDAKFADALSTSMTQGAINRNLMPKFEAPAYGKKGMKLKYKTKY